MRAGRASTTAKVVAYWRTLADLGATSVPGFSDPVAGKLLDGPFWSVMMARSKRLARKASRDRTKGFAPRLDSIILRVAFIDAVIAETGARQVVILGAGLDTRAWRLEALREARVYEVDHPATQEYKRARASRLGAPVTRVDYVAVDFARDDLERELRAAGLDATLPTLWIWEGVTMYLDDAALRGTLATVRRLSAPGSRLLAHYHEPPATGREARVRKALFALLGEPQIGLRTAATMKREITDAGFTFIEDAGLDEQAARVGTTALANAPLRVSRILVASG